MIIIPMAGLSTRFLSKGFDLPKYMLEAHGKSLFDWAILSFEKYFKTQVFLFICRDVYGTRPFIEKHCLELGIANFNIIELKFETLGQGHTVLLGLKEASVSNQEPLVIFNIDTYRIGYEFPKFTEAQEVSGYLECFLGSGPNWSNVITKDSYSDCVIRTSEKKNESNLCCTGLYFFSTSTLFREAYTAYHRADDLTTENEHFIAPIYNHLISKGKTIKVDIIKRSSVIFFGTPGEYQKFRKITLKL